MYVPQKRIISLSYIYTFVILSQNFLFFTIFLPNSTLQVPVFVDLKGLWTHAVQFPLKNLPTFMPKFKRVFVLVKWLFVMTIVNILAGKEYRANVLEYSF